MLRDSSQADPRDVTEDMSVTVSSGNHASQLPGLQAAAREIDPVQKFGMAAAKKQQSVGGDDWLGGESRQGRADREDLFCERGGITPQLSPSAFRANLLVKG